MKKNDGLIGFLVRHGDTNETGEVFLSRSDAPLNKDGIAEAHRACDFLADYDIKRIFSSPLIRALEPARILSLDYKPPLDVLQERGLLPWDRGIFTGVPNDEGEAALQLFVEHPDVKMPFGESRLDAEKRIGDFFDEQLPLAEQQMTAFFTHHSVIDILSYLVKGERPKKIKNLVEPGGIVAIYANDGDYRLEAVLLPSPTHESIS